MATVTLGSRHRRLDPPAGRDDRHRGAQADLRARLAATAASRSPARSTRSARSRGPSRTARACSTRSAARTRWTPRASSAPPRTSSRQRATATSPGMRIAHRARHARDGGRGARGASASVLDAAETLRGHGRRRSARSTCPRSQHGLSAYYIIGPAEASSNLARFDGIRYGHRVDGRRGRARPLHALPCRGLRHRGEAAHHARHLRAVGGLLRRLLRPGAEGAHAHRRATSTAAFADYDVLLTPTSPHDGVQDRREDGDPLSMYLSDVYTIPVNLAGNAGDLGADRAWARTGLPVGLQIIGDHFAEAKVFRAAARHRSGHRVRHDAAARARSRSARRRRDGPRRGSARRPRSRPCARYPHNTPVGLWLGEMGTS